MGGGGEPSKLTGPTLSWKTDQAGHSSICCLLKVRGGGTIRADWTNIKTAPGLSQFSLCMWWGGGPQFVPLAIRADWIDVKLEDWLSSNCVYV